jgi:CYTH domain-containing protein
MATEHEYKWLLDLHRADRCVINWVRHNEGSLKVINIQQGYLSNSLRLRSYSGTYEMTLKRKVPNRVIEITTELGRRDFDDLWELCNPILRKIRFIPAGNPPDQDWVLDMFLNGDEVYAAIAEVELEEGAPRPTPPEWLRKAMVYEVPLHDERFSSRSLADVEFARGLYDVVKAG